MSHEQGCGQRFPCKNEMSVERNEKFKHDGWAIPTEGHTVTSKPRKTAENQPLKMYQAKQ